MILEKDYGDDFGKPTRFKDKNGNRIHLGDYIHVQQYADDDERSFGALDYEGVVEDWNGEIMVVYYDFGICEGAESIHCFPKKFREILHSQNQKSAF